MFVNFFKGKKFKLLGGIFICLLILFFNVMDVYAYKITFNQSNGDWVVGTCYTRSNGFLSSGCIDLIGRVCNRWSPDQVETKNNLYVPLFESYFDREQWASHICINSNCTGYGCKNYCEGENLTGVEIVHGYLNEKKFNKDAVYYCVSGSSDKTHDNDRYDKCYVCNGNDNIMKWSTDGNEDNQCAAGYHESTTITEEGLCVTRPQSCYKCENDENVMGWGYSAEEVKNNDKGACSGNYKVSSITDKDLCVTKRPACYVCKDTGKSHIMQWGVELNTLSGCSKVEKDTTIDQSSCKTKTPSCYVCKDEGKSHIMGWGIELNTLPDCSVVEEDQSVDESLCKTKTPSCYVCDVEAEKHIMGWGYSPEDVKRNDNNACSGSYVEDSNINETACVTKKPACYICKDEGKGHIMEWGIELKTLPDCSQIEKDDTINESSCVAKAPSCYVCETDNKVMGWGYSAGEVKNKDTEKLCSGNYVKDENIKEDMCVTNVKTGQSGIYIIFAGFVGALIYIIYYYFKHVKKANV